MASTDVSIDSSFIQKKLAVQTNFQKQSRTSHIASSICTCPITLIHFLPEIRIKYEITMDFRPGIRKIQEYKRHFLSGLGYVRLKGGGRVGERERGSGRKKIGLLA